MRLRFFSAMIAIMILIPLVIWGGIYSLYAISFLVMLGASIEYKNMVLQHKHKDLSILFFSISILLFLRFLYSTKDFFYFFIVLQLVFWVYSIIKFSVFYKEEDNNKQIFSIVSGLSIGFLYVPVLMAFISKIRGLENGLSWLILFLAVVWIGDSGAYFTGRVFGNKKLSPGISPNKSIEGSIGAIFSSILIAVLFKIFFFKKLDFVDAFILGAIGNFLGQLGDLFESLLKRNFNIKDSGTFLPGHGGFLDRFDGIMFAAPFFYYYAIRFF